MDPDPPGALTSPGPREDVFGGRIRKVTARYRLDPGSR